MNNLQVFNNSNWSIRSVEKDGQTWFVAKDVCDILDIKNSRQALARLDDDEKGVTKNDTLGGKQKLQTVNEFGLYLLILSSNKPEAKEFKRWITHEVIPQIRQTGGYSLTKEIKDIDLLTLFWNDIIRKHRKIGKLELENEQLKAKIDRMLKQIHATYFDKFN